LSCNGVATQVAEVLHGATLAQAIAAIVAQSRSEFYFRQRLLQLVSQKKLQGRLDGEMFHARQFWAML
jgi:hypothetical protein